MRYLGHFALMAAVSLALGSFAPAFAQSGPQQQAAATAVSHARVVSLSLVKGTVAARKPGSREWFHATLNTPIEEGYSIATAKNGFAEVQFENGSTVRIGPYSRIEFTELALGPRSGRVNHLTLTTGLATIHVIPERHDEYVVNAAGATVTPEHGKTEFRTDVSRGRVRVEVFRGHVEAADSAQGVMLTRNHTVAFDARAAGSFQESARIQRDAWDAWSQERDREEDLAAYRRVDDPNRTGGLLYGWDDLVPFGGMGSFPDGSGDN